MISRRKPFATSNKLCRSCEKWADGQGQATTLNKQPLFVVYRTIGQPLEALPDFQHALVIRRQVGDRGEEAITLYNIAFDPRSGRPA